MDRLCVFFISAFLAYILIAIAYGINGGSFPPLEAFV